MKQAFYKSLVEKLEAACGIAPSDVLVTFVTNTDEDWSFGLGRAQFLTESSSLPPSTLKTLATEALDARTQRVRDAELPSKLRIVSSRFSLASNPAAGLL